MSAAEHIPITIISGFLGTGKTSLLNRVLQRPAGRRVAVLVNDFGAINVDSQLIINASGNVIALSNGCICCTIRDDLLRALIETTCFEPSPDHIVIETSGLSNPHVVMDTIQRWRIDRKIRLDAVLTVVDAHGFFELIADDKELALDQIAAADIVLVSKGDLVDRRQMNAVRAQIYEVQPSARVIEIVHGILPAEISIGFGSAGGTFARHRAWCRDDHSPASSNRHRVGRHTGFLSMSWTSDRRLAIDRVSQVIQDMSAGIYRGKGIFYLYEKSQRQAVWHLVGNRSIIEIGQPWGRIRPRTQVAVIGRTSTSDFKRLEDAFEHCAVG